MVAEYVDDDEDDFGFENETDSQPPLTPVLEATPSSEVPNVEEEKSLAPVSSSTSRSTVQTAEEDLIITIDRVKKIEDDCEVEIVTIKKVRKIRKLEAVSSSNTNGEAELQKIITSESQKKVVQAALSQDDEEDEGITITKIKGGKKA